MVDSRSFLANQKARNAIVGAENLLKLDNRTLHVHHFLTISITPLRKPDLTFTETNQLTKAGHTDHKLIVVCYYSRSMFL